MILRKTIRILLILLPVTLFFSVALSSILTVLLFLLAVFLWLKNIHVKLEYNKLDIAFGIYIVITLLSIFSSIDLNSGFAYLEKVLIILSYTLFFLLLRPLYVISEEVFNRILISFVISCAGFCIMLFYVSFADIIENGHPLEYFIFKNVRFQLMSLSPIQIHAPYLGLFLACAIFIVLELYRKRAMNLFLSIFLFLLFNFYLVLNSSLNSLLTVVFIYIFYGLLYLFKYNKLIFFGIIILGSIGVLILGHASYSRVDQKNEIQLEGYWETPEYRILRLLKEGDPDRQENWSSAFKVIEKNWIWGTGLGDLTENLQAHRDAMGYNYKNKVNTHNQYLQEFAAKGIFGLLSLMLFFVLYLHLWDIKKKFILSFIIVIASAFLTENVLDRQRGIIFFVFLLYIIYEQFSANPTKN